MVVGTVALLGVAAVAPTTAFAARALVAQPGAGTTEVGDASVDVVDFLDLGAGDEYVIVATGDPGDPVRLRVLLPDGGVESEFDDRELLQIFVATGRSLRELAGSDLGEARVREPATGIRLVELYDSTDHEGELEIPASGRFEIHVRARRAARIAAVVGAKERLEIERAARQPRTVAAVRAWYDRGLRPGASSEGSEGGQLARAWVAVPIAVSVAMSGLAVWWVALGARARRRDRRTRREAARPEDHAGQ